MSLVVNLAQINAAAKGNSDLRETLTSIHLALQTLYAQTGAGPLQKVDATATRFLAAPAQCGFSVAGANGSFTVTITLPQQAGGSSAPGNPSNAQIYQEVSSAPAANFASGVVTQPLTTATSLVIQNPGANLYWRLRSSYDQKTWNAYQVFPGGPVSAGLQSSAATEPNNPLNQSNFATVDSIAAGGVATVRIYGSGGVGTSWTSVLGANSKVIPSGTIMNVPYGSNGFVAWTGSMYQFKAGLTQTFTDSWIPVGKVSVIANGAGLVLPTIHAVVSGGAIVAYQIITPGNGMTTAPVLTITDSTGSGATATAVISAGAVTQVTPGSAGSSYSSTPTVTASGGVSGGVGGGGGPTGQNTGRFYGGTT
jgi:hypothetical protein